VSNWIASAEMRTRFASDKLISTRLHPGLVAVAAVAILAALVIHFPSADRSSGSTIVASPASSPPPPPSIQSERRIAGAARVVDGDTLIIHGTSIRLNGIDAPEWAQSCEMKGREYRCAEQATRALTALLAGRTTECIEVTRDRYQRIVARCHVGSIDIGGWMVEHGWAIAYRRYSLDYVEAEMRARSEKAGLWAGTFVEPEAWRRAHPRNGVHANR
jgi:endonuclease YncB( thermonuclease family)